MHFILNLHFLAKILPKNRIENNQEQEKTNGGNTYTAYCLYEKIKHTRENQRGTNFAFSLVFFLVCLTEFDSDD